MLKMTPRELAIAGCVILAIVLVATVVDASASQRQPGIVTPQVKETPRTLTSRPSVKTVICRVFGDRCAAALRVASCETGGTFNRWALGSAGERGLFQIHRTHWGWLDERRLFEVHYNARAAYRLSRGGRDWSHWSCQP